MIPLLTTRQGIRLSEILPKAKFFGAEEIFVQSCCGQWDDCESNDVFVAIVGPDADGHEFAHDAIIRGATAVVTERLLTIERPQCIVPDSRAAYGKICQALAGAPSQRLTTIGVSGSDGKTVTSHLIRGVLEAAGKRSGLASSIEVDLGQSRQSVPTKQMTAPWLADQLSQMAMADCDHAVVEVSSVSLAQRAIDGVSFDVSVITNIRRDHLDFHGSTENYRRAQWRMLKHLKPNGMSILNADDPTTHFLLEQMSTPVLTFGMKQDAQITGKVIERSSSEQTFIIQAGCESIPVRSSIVGDQHVYNCLAATAVGLVLGLELSTIVSGLTAVRSIPGRLERVECGQDFGVWIDAARSPFQLATAIRSLKQVSRGKVWCIFSTCEQQSELERRQLGEVVERSADHAIITKSTVDQTVDHEPAHQMLDGFDQPGKARLIPNRFRAIEWVLTQAKPGDAVLITGCGERPFALIGENNWTISDRDVCQAWLYDHSSMCAELSPNSDNPMIFDINDYR